MVGLEGDYFYSWRKGWVKRQSGMGVSVRIKNKDGCKISVDKNFGKIYNCQVA